jgi:hypothetical protein
MIPADSKAGCLYQVGCSTTRLVNQCLLQTVRYQHSPFQDMPHAFHVLKTYRTNKFPIIGSDPASRMRFFVTPLEPVSAIRQSAANAGIPADRTAHFNIPNCLGIADIAKDKAAPRHKRFPNRQGARSIAGGNLPSKRFCFVAAPVCVLAPVSPGKSCARKPANRASKHDSGLTGIGAVASVQSLWKIKKISPWLTWN